MFQHTSASARKSRFLRLTSLLFAAVNLLSVQAIHGSERPLNVIMILSDDLGWSDTTLYGTTELYDTPNLERLAEKGIRFTRAYSASPLCSPTRASILTGQNPARLGLTAPRAHIRQANESLIPTVAPRANAGEKSFQLISTGALDTRLPTLGKLIKEAGYATGHFGKWHLGHPPYSPLDHGFDVDIPAWPGPGPAGSFIAPWKYPDFEHNYPQEHIEDRMAEEAVTWIEERVAADEPFYMHYWQFSVHAPFDAREDYIEHYRHKVQRGAPQESAVYAAMVRSMDDSVGTLLDALERLGIADNTAVIFMSDNGGNMYNATEEVSPEGEEYQVVATSNAPLRGGKATMFEGGVRIPAVFYWPGLTPANAVSDAIIQTTDLYPTLLNLLGIPLPQNHPLDAEDITPALRGESFERSEGMITYFPHAPGVPDWLPPSVSVHYGDWKLIRIFHYGDRPGEHQYLLYNLAEDIGESNNLASRYPERVRELDRMIGDYLQRADVLLPPPNPDFDPDQFRPERIGVQPGGPKPARSTHQHAAAQASLQSPKAAAEPPRGEARTTGWRGRPQSIGLRVKNGELVVHSTAQDPWIATTLDEPLSSGAPFTLTFEIHTPHTGNMRHFPSSLTGGGFRPESMVSTANEVANQWNSHAVTLSTETPLTALRIGLPGQEGESRLRKIRLMDASGKTLAAWF